MDLTMTAYFLLVINTLGFFMMGYDKRKAKKNGPRVPERTLMTIAFFGGAAGSYLGMEVFRHKTKHKKFTVGVPLLLVVQVIGVYYLRLIGVIG